MGLLRLTLGLHLEPRIEGEVVLEQLRLILEALPWTIPAVIGGAILGGLSALIFASRRSRSDRFGVALLLWCLAVVLVVTLSPVKNNYFGIRQVGCDWSVWKPLNHHYWFSAGSRPPNVWLLLPAGFAVMLIDKIWRRVVGVAVLVLLPVAIEGIQDKFPALKRSCSSQDIVDNWTGLALGLAAGFVVALVIGMVRAVRRWRMRRNSGGGSVAAAHEDAVWDDGLYEDVEPAEWHVEATRAIPQQHREPGDITQPIRTRRSR